MSHKSTSIKMTLKVSSYILRFLLNAVFYIAVVIAVIYVSKAAYDFTYQLYGPVVVDASAEEGIYIKINKGDSTMNVAAKLELNRVIVNKYSFFLKTKLSDQSILAGTYELKASMTYKEILGVITDYKNSIIQDEDSKGSQEE